MRSHPRCPRSCAWSHHSLESPYPPPATQNWIQSLSISLGTAWGRGGKSCSLGRGPQNPQPVGAGRGAASGDADSWLLPPASFLESKETLIFLLSIPNKPAGWHLPWSQGSATVLCSWECLEPGSAGSVFQADTAVVFLPLCCVPRASA